MFKLKAGNCPPPPKRLWSSFNSAFTLAEVLITLGIIGVVAAMTMPTLISNYQKKLTVTRLKEAYSRLSQAIEHSQLDNSSTQFWTNASNQEVVEGADPITPFVETYITPYLKNVIVHGRKSPAQIGIKEYYRFLNGTFHSGIWYTNPYIVEMSNGQTLFFLYNTFEGTYREVLIYIDINGARNKPNKAGRDLFLFSLNFNNGFISPWGKADAENCKNKNNDGQTCAAKIINDGWQIKEDYPW